MPGPTPLLRSGPAPSVNSRIGQAPLCTGGWPLCVHTSELSLCTGGPIVLSMGGANPSAVVEGQSLHVQRGWSLCTSGSTPLCMSGQTLCGQVAQPLFEWVVWTRCVRVGRSSVHTVWEHICFPVFPSPYVVHVLCECTGKENYRRVCESVQGGNER